MFLCLPTVAARTSPEELMLDEEDLEEEKMDLGSSQKSSK